MKKRIAVILLSILAINNCLAQDSVIKNIDMNLVVFDKTKYQKDHLPISVNIKNNNSFPIKLLKPFDKKGNFLNSFWFTCTRTDKKWNSSSIYEQTEELNKLELLEYIEVPPAQEITFTFILNEILTEKLVPGKYTVIMGYNNQLGKNCLTGYTKAKNEVSIVVPEEVEDTPLPDYITKEKALDIAQKTNVIKYDQSQKVKIFLKDGVYTVIFPRKKLQEGTRAGDYASKIEIDARSGKVLSNMFGV
jgi:hypothetical protein